MPVTADAASPANAATIGDCVNRCAVSAVSEAASASAEAVGAAGPWQASARSGQCQVLGYVSRAHSAR